MHASEKKNPKKQPQYSLTLTLFYIYLFLFGTDNTR